MGRKAITVAVTREVRETLRKWKSYYYLHKGEVKTFSEIIMEKMPFDEELIPDWKRRA